MEVVNNPVETIEEDSASIESSSQTPTTSVVNKEGKKKLKNKLFSSFRQKNLELSGKLLKEDHKPLRDKEHTPHHRNTQSLH